MSTSYTNRTVYMPVDLMEAFSKHTGLFWSSQEIEGAICDAMAAAMQRQPENAAKTEAPTDGSANGYQWKQVFLPEGTVLRASFGRQPYFAVVEGSAIKYGEFSLSPSAFANLQGSGNRNAWKAVWLRFPGYKDWVRADACRAVRQAVTARLFDPGQTAVADEEEAKPAPPAGPYQQHYIDTRPSRGIEIPYFQLEQLFSEKRQAIDETAPAASPAATESPPSSKAHAPRPSWKGGKRRAGKSASRKRC
ncbi:hypothetical protein GCM10027277_00800 [Pseudoduganella ginsengisoli]|uniref:Uncharacterized protein n=1 Tax=Pseudoduganella ginsengisoli TaxID=1462440 RepID=A0A6L6Q359_9BURK|nr:hypothetical protein [Pseudoduganella ginsengisoli]MTW03854.1 hypothetical protein [Pseudoduganella ginsengisoli]